MASSLHTFWSSSLLGKQSGGKKACNAWLIYYYLSCMIEETHGDGDADADGSCSVRGEF